MNKKKLLLSRNTTGNYFDDSIKILGKMSSTFSDNNYCTYFYHFRRKTRWIILHLSTTYVYAHLLKVIEWKEKCFYYNWVNIAYALRKVIFNVSLAIQSFLTFFFVECTLNLTIVSVMNNKMKRFKRFFFNVNRNTPMILIYNVNVMFTYSNFQRKV